MALRVGGLTPAATRAYEWLRGDPARRRLLADEAVGGRPGRPTRRRDQHARLRRRRRLAPLAGRPATTAFARPMWPAVRRALDFVLGLQPPRGEIALGAGRGRQRRRRTRCCPAASSIHQACAARSRSPSWLDDPQPDWELAAGPARARGGRGTRSAFADKSRFSMDWYYPVLGGAVRGQDARPPAGGGAGTTFVVPGLGRPLRRRPSRGSPAAETCELVARAGRAGRRATGRWSCSRRAAPARTRTAPTGPGYVFADQAPLAGERSTWTAAAVVLAADALSRTTRGAGIFRGATMPRGRCHSDDRRRRLRLPSGPASAGRAVAGRPRAAAASAPASTRARGPR